MITGFNTDIEYDGVTYHIQTEDKGLGTPLILSLVYNQGTILASKRSPYDDLLENGFDEKILAERVQKQHRLICAAVLAGRIEDLKQMTKREAASRAESGASAKSYKSRNNELNGGPAAAIEEKTGETASAPAPPAVPTGGNYISLAPITINEKPLPPIPQPTDSPLWESPLKVAEPEVPAAAAEVVEAGVLAADAVEVVPGLYQSDAAENGQLRIQFLSDTDFQGGQRKTLTIRVFRSTPENFVGEASIIVKVLGSSFRPLILHARTDSNGIAGIDLHLPHFRSGRGAVLVRAMSDGEEVELRHVIRQG